MLLFIKNDTFYSNMMNFPGTHKIFLGPIEETTLGSQDPITLKTYSNITADAQFRSDQQKSSHMSGESKLKLESLGR